MSHCTVQCIVIGPVCGWVCLCGSGWVYVCVRGSVTTILEIACIDPYQTGFVDKGSDHLRLIKLFWLSHAPGKGVCSGVKNFGSALLQPVRSVCVSCERFFIYTVETCCWAELMKNEIKVTLSQTNCCRGTVQSRKWQLTGIDYSTVAQASGCP